MRHHLRLSAGIALFLIGQLFSVAHAAEYGSAPHEHNSVACLAILTDEPQGLALPDLSVPVFSVVASKVVQLARQDAPAERPEADLPPPRGPPSL